jgi:rhodanese-related sulfurtransferase
VAWTRSGVEIPFDMGILAVGVKPSVELARKAGIRLGHTGAIEVDSRQRTSDPSIYAAGDNSESHHLVLKKPVSIPLAGPANKAGRVAGANAALDLLGADEEDPRRLRFRGVLGTAGVRVCGLVAGTTGISEALANEEELDYSVTYMSGASHASYYPGAERMSLKVLHDPKSGKLLGAQCVGGKGVDKRIDILATAITAGMSVEDLEQLDLCYAPPFGAAKDIAILTGFAGANVRRGTMPETTPGKLLKALAEDPSALLLDVRTRKEYLAGHLTAALNIPVDDLRNRLDELPKDRRIFAYCHSGYRSYVAQRILLNRGWNDVWNVQGGYQIIERFQATRSELAASVGSSAT